MSEAVGIAVVGTGDWGANLVRNFANVKGGRLSYASNRSARPRRRSIAPTSNGAPSKTASSQLFPPSSARARGSSSSAPTRCRGGDDFSSPVSAIVKFRMCGHDGICRAARALGGSHIDFIGERFQSVVCH